MIATESQKVTPFLWFDDNAEDAVDFYLSVFPNASKSIGLPGPNGTPLTVSFVLKGLGFTALNGGPQFTFDQAISFVVRCNDQAEIDCFWKKLTANGDQRDSAAGSEIRLDFPGKSFQRTYLSY